MFTNSATSHTTTLAPSASQPKDAHLRWAHRLWRQVLTPGDLAIDATAGRGHDTLELCRLCLTEDAGSIIGIDIQQEAINSTRALLHEKLAPPKIERIQLFMDSHTNIDRLASPKTAKLIVYNLGYLPKSDHRIITNSDSTIEALHRSLEVLRPDGAISVMCYPGHDGGAEECNACCDFFVALASRGWQVQFVRSTLRATAPLLIWAEHTG